jgi:hypothetical protein
MSQPCLRVFFGKHEVFDNDKLPLEYASERLAFHWPVAPGELNTLLIYEIKPFRLLYAAINIQQARLDTSEQIVPYEAPATAGRRYVVELLRQANFESGLDERSSDRDIDAAADRMTRLCKLSFELVPSMRATSGAVARSEAPLAPEGAGREKWCHCRLHLSGSAPEKAPAAAAAQLPAACGRPAAKAAAAGAECGRCDDIYAFDALSDLELRDYANMRRIAVPRPYDREVMLRRIEGETEGATPEPAGAPGGRRRPRRRCPGTPALPT